MMSTKMTHRRPRSEYEAPIMLYYTLNIAVLQVIL